MKSLLELSPIDYSYLDTLDWIILNFLISLRNLVRFSVIYIILFCLLISFSSLLYSFSVFCNCFTYFSLFHSPPPRTSFKDSYPVRFKSRLLHYATCNLDQEFLPSFTSCSSAVFHHFGDYFYGLVGLRTYSPLLIISGDTKALLTLLFCHSLMNGKTFGLCSISLPCILLL